MCTREQELTLALGTDLSRDVTKPVRLGIYWNQAFRFVLFRPMLSDSQNSQGRC